MHWIYILKCQDNCYYVGETKRLYRRVWEHQNGKGGINTSTYTPENIVAIYKVDTLCKFFDYNHIVTNKICNIYFNRIHKILEKFNTDEGEYDKLVAENNITECLMLKTTNFKIRGGKYTRFDIEYSLPVNECIKKLPLCKCGLPCDIKKNDNYLFFRCAKKNMWSSMKEEFNIDCDPCNYFMKYDDNEYNQYYNQNKKIIEELVNKSEWLVHLIGSMYEHCVGGCEKMYDENNTVRYRGRAINLCFDCFINKHDELSKKYNQPILPRKCLISL